MGETGNGNDNLLNKICWILSILCWLLLIITEMISFHDLRKHYIIWTFYRVPISYLVFYGGKGADNDMQNYPNQVEESFLFILFVILLIFTFFSFCFYIIKTTVKKDPIIYDAMFGNETKFHFIPLLCPSILFIIGEATDFSNLERDNGWGLAFVIIGLISLIFIYIKTNLPCDWFPASIKKGTYSCLIALEWYYFCYDICSLKINNTSEPPGDDYRDAVKGFSGFFNLFIGVGACIFAIYFKDVVVAAIYFLIYLGMTIFFFKVDNDFRFNGGFEGAIDVIMMILFLAEAAFIVIKYKTECLQ